MGPQEYQDALDALNSPDAPAPVKAAAKRLVSRYSSAMAKDQLANRSEASLADRPTDFGPQGLDAMAAGGLQPAEDFAAREQQIAASEAKHPGIARALSLRAPTLAPAIPDVDPNELRRRDESYDASLPNASKRRDLAAPVEWHPPAPANPQSPFDSVWGKLTAAKNALPDWAGGSTEHFVEPSIEQFRLEMAPVLGADIVSHVGLQDDAFREYADMKYQQALQKAQAEGRGIVREAFTKGPVPSLPLIGSLTKAGKTLKSGLIGADQAITGGIGGTGAYLPHLDPLDPFQDIPAASFDDLRDAYRGARREKDLDAAFSPVAKDAGFFLGALHPKSIGNIAGVAAGKVGGAAAAGFAGSAATTLAHDLPDVAFGDQTLGTAAEIAAAAGAFGAPLGILGGMLGQAARNEGATLRRETDLGLAEEGGAQMRPVRGVDPGPVNEGLAARARAEGVGRPSEPDVPGMLAHDLSEPFGKRAHARQEELLARGQPLREFEREFAGETHPLKNTIRAILEAKKKLVQSDGTVASVNQPEMAKLDKLLDDVASRYPQAPEYRLNPADPRRLDQLERAVAVHGDLGTPESFRRDVQNINEMSTPTRAVTPQAQAVPASERAPLATIPDFGPYAENLPDVEGGIAAGMAGERIRSLHQERLGSPDAFDVTPTDARSFGLQAGAPDDFVRVLPKGKNPGDLKEIVAGVRRRHESTSATSKEPFPDYDKIKRALHQDRDAFRGETDAIKQSDTFTLQNGETVRGYSAANARLEDDMKGFENLLDLLGYRGKPPDMRSAADSMPMENLARRFGEGGRPPEIDRAFRQMAAETGMTPTLDNLRRYLAMKRLEQATKLREVIRFGGVPSVGMLTGQAARLRLDPVVQGAIPYLESAGSLGALPGEIEQSRQLPGMADQTTLDEIRRALQP